MTDSQNVDKPRTRAPALTVLGSLHALTLTVPKMYGKSDGFTFMGVDITNASP